MDVHDLKNPENNKYAAREVSSTSAAVEYLDFLKCIICSLFIQNIGTYNAFLIDYLYKLQAVYSYPRSTEYDHRTYLSVKSACI